MKQFHIGVKGVIVQDGYVLVLRKANKTYEGLKRYWEFPGGRIEEGETFEAAFQRELSEELPGVRLKSLGKLLHAEPVPKYEDYPDFGLILMFFQVEVEPIVGSVDLSDEHDAYDWVKPKDAVKLVSGHHQKAVAELLART